MALHALSEPGHHPGPARLGHGDRGRPEARPRGPAARGRVPVAQHVLRRVHAVRGHTRLGRHPRLDARRGPGPARPPPRRAVRLRRPGVHLLQPVHGQDAVPAARPGDAGARPGDGGGPGSAPSGVRPAPVERPGLLRAWLRRLFEDCERPSSGTPGSGSGSNWPPTPGTRRRSFAARGSTRPCLGVGRAQPGRGRDANQRGQAGRGPHDRHRPRARRRRGLTFVPTSFGWPHLMVLHAPGWRPVIHYPVHGPELPSPASVEILKLRMEALAHPMRMRLCRNLARSPYTTSELADAHGITAPEVSRHSGRPEEGGASSHAAPRPVRAAPARPDGRGPPGE